MSPTTCTPHLEFYVNGKHRIERHPDPQETLISWLRRHGLTGTKLGCAEGGCGSCTVVVSHFDYSSKSLVHVSVNACLAPVAAMHHKHVITVEGLGSSKSPHPVQERIAKFYGSQCGFCTPGIVMSLYAMLKTRPETSDHDIEEAFDGNLCRCTGYRPILDGAKTFVNSTTTTTKKACQSSCSVGGFCQSPNGGNCASHGGLHVIPDIEEETSTSPPLPSTSSSHPAIAEREGSVQLEFPKELLDRFTTGNLVRPESYCFEHYSTGGKWYHPASVDEFLSIMHQHPQAKIINGNTEIGIEARFKGSSFPILVYPADITELKTIQVNPESTGVWFGACMTLASFMDTLKKYVDPTTSPFKSYQVRGFQALLDNLKWFAGNQIRNVAAIAGNIVTASPISDLNPVFVAMGAILKVQSKAYGVRNIPMEEFFLGYRKTALKPSEIVLSIFIPFTKQYEFIRAYKQSKRKDDDIAIVNAGLRVLMEKATSTVPSSSNSSQWIVADASFAYGGMAPTTIRPLQAIKLIKGRVWNYSSCSNSTTSTTSSTGANEDSSANGHHALIKEICNTLLQTDMPMSASTPGGQVEYRKSLAVSFMVKFGYYITSELALADGGGAALSLQLLAPQSVLDDIQRPPSYSCQSKEEASASEIVGASTLHASALKQVTGEAVYLDDMPRAANELYAVVVGSTEAHAHILSVDASEALAMDGVVDYISWKDIPDYDVVKMRPETTDPRHNPNMIGPVSRDEELFATKEVHHVNQVLGIIVAENEVIARAASRKVKVQYKKLPAIFTIEEAIEKSSYIQDHSRELSKGYFAPATREKVEESVDKSEAVHYVEGDIRMSAQEHFYLETNAALVVPSREDSAMECHVSTQHPTECQHTVAHVLGIQANKVVVRVKRMGGGFGGKESRAAFLVGVLAVAANKHNVPVRSMLGRDDDMAIIGMRHPFLGKYKVGFTAQGRLISLEADIYSNAGYSADLSKSVLERAICHIDNAYRIPNVLVRGKVCRTNLPTNTAFRGFGGPQGMMIAEAYITHVAEFLKRPVEEIRALNLYKPFELTHFNQVLEEMYIERCWHELMSTSDFKARQLTVEEFNSKSKFKKRGIVAIPTKFGIAFGARFLNQAGALVHVYNDGSVLVSHGGTEMGQGLHTKMIQVTARALGVPISKVHISETNTMAVANTSATAASASSDLNGMAIIDACNQILERLKPVRAKKPPTATWDEIVWAAYFDRINLSANGFYKTPNIDYDWENNKGRNYNYFTYGTVATEVEIDVLTGDHTVLRSDIVMDIGKSINPEIDMGQIEGGFVQGQGWCTIEEPLISPVTGALLTKGPGAYKIPGFRDIPVDFRVRFIRGSRNVHAVHSSKAVGEPPFFLGASVFYAIREAIKSSRSDNGIHGYFKLDCPATAERIRLACVDDLVKMAATPLKEGEKPWSIRA